MVWRVLGVAAGTGFAVLLALAPVRTVLAAEVLPLSLAEMVDMAGPIFAGEVESVAFDTAGRLPVTHVTFLVSERIRGVEAERITLTLPGGRQSAGRLPYRIAGLPVFRKGDRMILLAYPESSLGLTSPVGLGQGRFDIRAGPAGLAQVAQALPSRRLLEGVGAAVLGHAGLGPRMTGVGPSRLPYGAFVSLLRELVAARVLPPTGTPRTQP